MAAIQTPIAPKRFSAMFELDSRQVADPLPEILSWINQMLSGKVYYRVTKFRDPKINRRVTAPVRQRHFDDDYAIFTFWVTNRSDAMIFRLRFSSFGQ